VTTTSSLYRIDRLLIGSQWSTRPREEVVVVDPYTEQAVGVVPEATEADADAALRAAHEAWKEGTWSRLSFAERGEVVGRIADGVAARKAEFDELYVRDLGGVAAFAPFVSMQAEFVLRDFAKLAGTLSAEPEPRSTTAGDVVMLREPVGPVVAIVPWNAPLALAVVKLAPALIAGCPVVVKVDPVAPLAGLLLAEVVADAGLPDGVVSFLPGGRELGRYLVEHPLTAHISFTGSTAAGREVLRSSALHMARTTLELGGKGAAIMLEDLDPGAATAMLLPGCLAQSGQVCTTYSRLLVPRSRYEEWVSAIAATFTSTPMGDPSAPTTLVGPLSSAAHRDRVEEYIASAREEGATVVTGGGRPAQFDTGYFIEPTLISDARPDMKVVREEVFGPVIVVMPYEDVDDAIRIANDSDFGLGNGIFTGDVEYAKSLAPKLHSGTVAINNSGSCMTAPFGGVRNSGIGREGGVEGIEAFLEFKQINLPAPTGQ
jgi:aldehyde dehydrogenase (NAD+)